MLHEQLSKITIDRELQLNTIMREQFDIGSVYLELSAIEKTELLKQLLNELLRQQLISHQQLDTIYKLVDSGKIELATSINSRIMLYLDMLVNDLLSLIGLQRPKILAYYSTCERKIYILIDRALFTSFVKFLIQKIDLKTAYAFYIILTHELVHALAAEKPKLFYTAFRESLVKWYKTFITVLDPYSVVFNPATTILSRLFNQFEKIAGKLFCQTMSENEFIQIVNTIAEAWFKPDILIQQKTPSGISYYSLDSKKVPDGYYRDVVYDFIQTLLGIMKGDYDRIMRHVRRLEPAFQQAYSVIGVSYPNTFFHQELVFPSEIIAIAVMYKANYTQQLWQLVPVLAK